MAGQKSATAPVVEAVARALTIALSDPSGQTTLCMASGSPEDTCLATLKLSRNVEQTRKAVTVFHSSAVPPVGIDRYLARLASTFRCSEATFVAALILADRLLAYDGGRLPLTALNVHRVFLASLVAAVKFNEDRVYSNAHYAKAGGVHVKEVNRLERVLLSTLDFNLRVTAEEYARTEATLLALLRLPTPPASQARCDGCWASRGPQEPAGGDLSTGPWRAAPAPATAPGSAAKAAAQVSENAASDGSTGED